MPDDAHLDRFRPPRGGAAGSVPVPVPVVPVPVVPAPVEPAPGASPEALAAALQETPVAEATTWDEWSHAHRDRRERTALVTRIRGDRGARGVQHARAVEEHRRQVRRATIFTAVVAVIVGFLWIKVIGARDAAIEHGLGAREFAPGGFVLIVLTALVTIWLLRLWRTVSQRRVDPLQFASLPDSPDAPRHGAFDGTTQPPTRW